MYELQIIKKLAETVRSELNLNTKEQIDLTVVLNELKISLKEEKEPMTNSSEPVILIENHKCIIYFGKKYNNSDITDKILLTETLADLLLHIDVPILSTDRDSLQAHQENKSFVLEFLMPEILYRGAIHDLTKDDRINIQDLAKQFEVSEQLAFVRGRQLGIFRLF